MTSRIEKVLQWSIFGAVFVVLGIGWVLEVTTDESPETAPCLDPALSATLGSLELGDIARARADLQRRRSAHERALGQLRSDPLWADPEQQPWLTGAVADEESIIDELEAAEAGLVEAESCAEAH